MHQGVGIGKQDPILVFGFGNFKGFGAKNFIQCQDILQRSARGKQMDIQSVPFPTALLSLDQFYDNQHAPRITSFKKLKGKKKLKRMLEYSGQTYRNEKEVLPLFLVQTRQN